MNDTAFRAVTNAMACLPDAEAQINILEAIDKFFVQQANFIEHRAANEAARGGDSLAIPRLTRRRHAIQTLQPPQMIRVNHASARADPDAGVLNQFAAGIEQAAPDRADLGVDHDFIKHRIEPARERNGVVVEQQNKTAARGANALIARFRE
ncbi:MAG TPA: hypothetical protein VF492_04780, partial [Verrucomicrobiae bacterium]